MVLTVRGAAEARDLARHLHDVIGPRATVGTLQDTVVIDVPAEHLVDVARIVRDDPQVRCELYSINAGVDLGNGEMRSVTIVRGITTNALVMLRTSCATADPRIPSLVEIWPGANWCERETYDMFGIHFEGHPDPRRIFLEDTFPGHPLRKSFLPPRSDARGG